MTISGMPCRLCGGVTAPLPVPAIGQSMLSDGRIVSLPLAKLSCLECGATCHVTPFSEAQVRSFYNFNYAVPIASSNRDAASAVAYASWVTAHVATPNHVVEIGCGSGALLHQLAKHWPDARFFGVDPALPATSSSNNRVRLERGFIDALPNDVGPFDLVLAINVLEHLRNPGDLFATLRNRLTPNGCIAVVCPTACPPNIELLFLDHIHTLTTVSLSIVAQTHTLCPKEQHFAPSAIGDFMLTLFGRNHRPDVDRAAAPVTATPFGALAHAREAYLGNWAELDNLLLERIKPEVPVLAFGAGQTAALIRAYAPRTWQQIDALVVDTPSDAWDLGKPVMGYATAIGHNANVLIATAPRLHGLLADRLTRDGLNPIRFDDVIPR